MVVSSCISYSPVCRHIEPAVQVRGRTQSTASTSSSEISVADDNTSIDMLQDVLRNRDILRTKVSLIIYHLYASCWTVSQLDSVVFDCVTVFSCDYIMLLKDTFYLTCIL